MGREILSGLLTADRWRSVHALGRRRLDVTHLKLTSHVRDLLAPWPLPAIDDAFIALGTTIKMAGSRAAFRVIDFEMVLAVARAAREAGATRLGVISAMGADPNSRIFYNQIKGQMEEAVSALGYTTLVIARPSMLEGDRTALKQVARSSEQRALRAMRWLGPLIPPNFRPIAAARVAQALLKAEASEAPGERMLRSGEMQAS